MNSVKEYYLMKGPFDEMQIEKTPEKQIIAYLKAGFVVQVGYVGRSFLAGPRYL